MQTKLILRLALGCLLALAACGGDDDDADKQSAADAGSPDAGGGAAGSGGGKGTGSGKEGTSCDGHADCASGLSCLRADESNEDIKVCARPCQSASDCESGERCDTETKSSEDLMCWNTEGEPLQPCGPQFTAKCDMNKQLGCLYFDSGDGPATGGVCLQPCALNKDDACPSGFSCLDIINEAEEGLCVRTVERGEQCDEPKGEFCQPGNLCLSDKTSWRCYQDCSESSECDDDKMCRELEMDEGAYCE
jgi:hypothetical protein